MSDFNTKMHQMHQILASVITLLYSKPETGMHATTMSDWLSVTVYIFISCQLFDINSLGVVHLQITNSSLISLSATLICNSEISFQTHYGMINRRHKSEPAFWSQFTVPVSGTKGHGPNRRCLKMIWTFWCLESLCLKSLKASKSSHHSLINALAVSNRCSCKWAAVRRNEPVHIMNS